MRFERGAEARPISGGGTLADNLVRPARPSNMLRTQTLQRQRFKHLRQTCGQRRLICYDPRNEHV